MTFKSGQRLKFANGFVTPEGVIIAPNATAEILSVGTASLGIITKWKLGNGDVAEWTGTIPLQDVNGQAILIAANGRPMFPGEKPPALGTQFGITGQNNDYSKLKKQGRPTGTVVTTNSAPAVAPAVATATVGTVVTGVPALTAVQQGLLGTACQTPNCSGQFVELAGTLKKGPDAGTPYLIVKCSVDCGARIRRDGTVQLGSSSRRGQSKVAAAIKADAAKVAAGVAAAVAAATPFFTAGPLTAAVQGGATIVLDEVEPDAPATKAPKAPKAPKGASGTFTFPTTMAMKLANDVRTMTKQGTTDMTFSLRKCLSWGTASVHFAKQGVPENEAIAAGFRLVAFDREVEESQGKLEQLFQSIFAFKPTLKGTHPAVQDDAVIGMSLSAGLNLWISGPTGCGKTYSVLEKLQETGRKFIRIQGGGDVTRETLVGYAALENGSSVFKPGPLTLCVENGWVIVIDEIDKLRDEVLSELTAVAEGNPLVLMDDGGRTIAIQSGFSMIATANTVGRGEGMMYNGTKTVNEALRDRFVFLNADYHNQRDMAILANHVLSLGAVSK